MLRLAAHTAALRLQCSLTAYTGCDGCKRLTPRVLTAIPLLWSLHTACHRSLRSLNTLSLATLTPYVYASAQRLRSHILVVGTLRFAYKYTCLLRLKPVLTASVTGIRGSHSLTPRAWLRLRVVLRRAALR